MAFLELESTLHKRYKILSVLGMGSFGTVYEAADSKDDHKRVAIKEGPMQLVADFERQADVRGTLVHPAIPKVHDFFSDEDSGKAYIVMDLIEGRDLEAVLDESVAPVSEIQVVDWGIQLCDVLDYLHTHPIHPTVFRDIKPNNIMMHKTGELSLIDFELARVYPPGFFENADPAFNHYKKGLMLGTEGYSPPEQYEGIALPQSDLYALGATLHHLITKRDPREGTPHSFDQHPISTLNPFVTEEFEVIIIRATQTKLGDRYKTAAEMQHDLEMLSTQLALKGNLSE